MPQMIKPAPVRKSFIVKATPAHAFRVFTAGIARWWPATHTIGSSPLKTIIIEEREGGRWYAIGEDGSECDSGRVLVWDPPSRLVLDWQINADWKFDPDLHTDIEVRFLPEGEGATRVEFEHRDLERFGERAEAVRSSIEPGWGMILDRFANEAAA